MSQYMKKNDSDNRKKLTEHLMIGLMSGTSLDGVDAVLVSIESDEKMIRSIALVDHYYLPYTQQMRDRINALCQIERSKIDELVLVHCGLSYWYASAVKALLAKSDFNAEDIDAIGMHGQTVWHSPVETPFPAPFTETVNVKGTLQLGNASYLKHLTGIPVVSDFRSADMAAGGEGAPLAPFTDYMMFGSDREGRIVQNIGGIGNATVLPKETGEKGVYAFDTGPGNMIMDAVVEYFSDGKLRYDEGGAVAGQGIVNEQILQKFFDEDSYFHKGPPKSTGREVYGKDFALKFINSCRERDLSYADTLATATAFTAETICRSYIDFILPKHPISTVIIGGGGALNDTLLDMIRQRLPQNICVRTTRDFGIPEDAREAMAFAVMAYESLMGRTGNLPAVTGATEPKVLGMITL